MADTATLTPSSPGGGRTIPYVNSASTNERNILEGADLADAQAADRTIELRVPPEAKKIRLMLFMDWGSATDITITPSGSADGTNFASWTSRSTSSGTGTLSEFKDVFAHSADKNIIVDYDVEGMQRFKAVFSDTGGTATTGPASDTFDVQGMIVLSDD